MYWNLGGHVSNSFEEEENFDDDPIESKNQSKSSTLVFAEKQIQSKFNPKLGVRVL